MGATKRLLEENEHLQNLAIKILLESKALRTCELHSDIYLEGESDVQDAYKLANFKISSGDLELPDHVSRKDFTDVIKKTYEEYWFDDCSLCDKMMED